MLLSFVHLLNSPTCFRAYKSFVNKLLRLATLQGWKTERVVEEYHDGRIILVQPNDPKSHLKKMEEVRDIVDIDLGESLLLLV